MNPFETHHAQECGAELFEIRAIAEAPRCYRHHLPSRFQQPHGQPNENRIEVCYLYVRRIEHPAHDSLAIDLLVGWVENDMGKSCAGNGKKGLPCFCDGSRDEILGPYDSVKNKTI